MKVKRIRYQWRPLQVRGFCFRGLLEMAKKGGVQSGSYVFGNIEEEMVMYRRHKCRKH